MWYNRRNPTASKMGEAKRVKTRSKGVVAAFAAVSLFACAACGELVWDATQSGRLMTATNDIVLFKCAKLSDVRLAKCWFNKARRRRADGTWTMCNGEGRVCHAHRSDDGRALEAQCQLFDARWTKCVKLRLTQSGDDITGRILYAKYCTERDADRVGVNFDVLDNSAPQPVYSVMPNGRTTNGYNVDWLALREVGSAEDNIPDASNDVMPTDKVMDWMENAVDSAAWAKWRQAHPAPFHLFGEDRQYAVRNNIIPAHWFAKGNRAAERFHGVAQPGEFYSFQVCVAADAARKLRWSAKTALKVSCITPVECEVATNGVKPIWVMVDIPKDAAGKTLRGEVLVEDATDATSASLPFEIEVKGDVLENGGIGDAWRLARLKWLNSDIGREDTVTKPYEPIVVDKANRTVRILGRELVLGDDGLPAQVVSYFNGSNTHITGKGMNLLAEPVGFEATFSTGGGTTSVQQQEKDTSASARQQTDSRQQEQGKTTSERQQDKDKTAGVQQQERDTAVSARQQVVRFTEITPAHAAWRAEADIGGGARRIVEGRIDFAGECRFRIRIEGVKVEKAVFEMKMPADVARFREGLGTKGGFFTEEKIEHKWDPKFNRDAVWLGNVNGGLMVRFKGANYRRPLINAYYAWQKLRMPESWAAGGGTITLTKCGGEIGRARCPQRAEQRIEDTPPYHAQCNKQRVEDAPPYHAQCGEQRIGDTTPCHAQCGTVVLRAEAGDAPEGAEWNFDLYITPFHKLDMKTHLGDRYYHLSQRRSDLDTKKIRDMGATVVNIHHNTIWNPYINYPYNDDSGPLLKKAVKDAHDAGLLLKVYYTTRELTQNLPEFFALKSLDGEVLLTRDASVPGWPCTNRGGPHPWLREHVGLDILPAWRENVRFPQAYPPRLDLAMITTPDTRWDNFYLEGLNYLVREYGIDGLYIDDTALTGESMQRARRILDRDGRRRLVDNHSWNHHDARAGSGSTNLAFIDLYPYFDLLWRGEGFYNDTPPDFWLIERSGIPFGIAGEMLGRGNPFRGMLFGMTDRAGWGGGPTGLWRFFDEVKLGDMELVGWWDDDCPVRIEGSPDVKASVWKGKDGVVLIIANFAKEPRTATIAFDAEKLGFDNAQTKWSQLEIAGIQKAAAAPDFAKPVEVPAGGGFILVSRTVK